MRNTRLYLLAFVALLVAGLIACGLNTVAAAQGIGVAVLGYVALNGIAADLGRWSGLIDLPSFGVSMRLGISSLMTYPRIAAVGDACGCSLTNTKFEALTPDKIEGMGMTAYEEDIWSRVAESRIVGVTPNTLHDLLLSRIKDVSKEALAQKSVGRTTKFAPFKYRLRKRNKQMSYFNVASGEATPGAGSNGIPASAWDLIINLGSGEYATEFKNLGRFFLLGHWITVEHRNVATNVAYNTSHKVIAVEDVDADNARVTVAAPFSSNAAWNALSAGEQAIYQPEFGTVTILANDFSDWENACQNAPTDNNQELLIDWFQTSRETRCRNKEYEAALKEILDGNVNSYLKKFREIDVTERNRQEMAYWNAVFLNTAFFGQRINEHQVPDPTWADIEGLDVVRDPEDPACEYERKAHALGIHTQLVEEGRRIDLQGGRLDFDLIMELLHKMRRVRKLDGRDHPVIDLMMDRHSKHQFDTLLIRYLKQTYATEYTKYFEKGQVIDPNGGAMFEYTKYDLPLQHLQVGIFSHEFFEDRLSAFGNGTGGRQGTVNNKNRGRMIMALDWEDIAIGIFGTNSVKREYKNEITAQANPLYSCRMKLNTKEFDLRSTTWDVEIGDFDRHLILENFSDECPSLTVSFCEPSAAS